jgi:multicomponent Na+:H+ antiporter subunit F
MLLGIVCAVLVSMVLVLARCFAGPSTYDRILAANSFGTKTVVLIALLSFIADNMMFLDIALVYAFINFITTIAFLKYFRDGTFGEGVRK